MTTLDPSRYPEPVAGLLRRLPLAPLGPGTPVRSERAALEALDDSVPIACRAGLWLAFDFLDESHVISQDLHTTEGSYWHALMHRREPDFWNSKYWFRQVGTHPLFADLAKAAELGHPSSGAWDPFAFVDACERAIGKGGPEEERCRRVQRAEWELLFAWCFAAGVARGS